MGLRWYVVQCLPRCEGWAVENISKQGFSSYWPRYEVKQKRGIGRNYYRGVFPGYLFVSFDSEYDNWRRLFGTFGIRKLLGCNDVVQNALPRGFIETMMSASGDGLIELPKEDVVHFSVGDKLKITEGPLAGHVGVFKYSEKGRVALLLSLLGGENQVIIPADKVAYAGAPL